MKKLIVLAILAAGVYFYAWPKIREKVVPAPGQAYAREARLRSEEVLKAMQGTSDSRLGTPDQYGLCQWAEGKIVFDRDKMNLYSDRWDAFRQRKDLFRRIKEYEVVEVKVPDPNEPVAIVDLRIEGRSFKWKVTKGEPIAWAD